MTHGDFDGLPPMGELSTDDLRFPLPKWALELAKAFDNQEEQDQCER